MEAIGAASAILQIATTGIQTSVKLVTFAGQVKTASERITRIAEDVSLNSSILQQLGELMKESLDSRPKPKDNDNDNDHADEKELPGTGAATTKQSIFSPIGLETTMKLAARCNEVFASLEKALLSASEEIKSGRWKLGVKIKLSRTEMLRWPFMKPEMDTLQEELRDTKGTLMLMLQVAMLALSRKTMGSGHHQNSNVFLFSTNDQDLLIRSIAASQKSQKSASHQDAPLSTQDQDKRQMKDANKVNDSDKWFSAATMVPSPRHSTMSSSSEATTSDSKPSANSPDKTKGVNSSPRQSSNFQKHNPTHGPPRVGVKRSIFTPILEAPAPLPSRDFLIYLLEPFASIQNSKILTTYRSRSVEVENSIVQGQLQKWKDSSPQPTTTILDQLLSLTEAERSALDAISGRSSIIPGPAPFPVPSPRTLEWIHFGDWAPVLDGVPNLKARMLTIVTRERSQTSLLHQPVPSTRLQTGAQIQQLLAQRQMQQAQMQMQMQQRPRLGVTIDESVDLPTDPEMARRGRSSPEEEGRGRERERINYRERESTETASRKSASARDSSTVYSNKDDTTDDGEEEEDIDDEAEGIVDELLARYTTL